MGGHNVAGEGSPVEEQDIVSLTGKKHRAGGPGAAGADDYGVVHIAYLLRGKRWSRRYALRRFVGILQGCLSDEVLSHVVITADGGGEAEEQKEDPHRQRHLAGHLDHGVLLERSSPGVVQRVDQL